MKPELKNITISSGTVRITSSYLLLFSLSAFALTGCNPLVAKQKVDDKFAPGVSTTSASSGTSVGPPPSTVPVITTPATSTISSTNSLTVGGTCSADTVSINIYANSVLRGTTTCTTLAFSVAITVATDNVYSVTATGVSSTGGETTASNSVSWTYDTTAPTISALAFNSGSSTFATINFGIDVTASDGASGSGISYYCYSESNASTCPSGTWLSYSTGSNRSVVANYTNGSRPMYIWVKDAAGNISNASSITFTMSLSSAPVISTFTVANIAGPSSPPTGSETTFASTAVPMHLWWTASVSNGTVANPYSLYYSTDLINWTTISASFGAIAAGSTAVNETNITTYNVPSTSAIFLRLGIKDSLGQTTYATSTQLNSNYWRLVAGNSDRGLGGSALSARPTSGYTRGNQSLAYSATTRRLYFIDTTYQKLTYVDPATGLWVDTGVACTPFGSTSIAIDDTNQRAYMKCFGDANVKLIDLSTYATSNFYLTSGGHTTCGVALDNTNSNLYTCYDDSSLYKIPINTNGTAGVPVKILGNGTSGAITDGANPLATSAQYLGWGTPVVSKNGTLYFKDWTANLWRFNSTLTTITKVTSTGTSNMYGIIAQGRSGEELLSSNGSGLYSVDGSTGTATLLAGHASTSGDQADGTDALSTRILTGEGVIATSSNVIYFVDQVNPTSSYGMFSRIRTIDANNKIQTVLGTIASYGSGGAPISARFTTTATFSLNPYDGNLYSSEYYYARKLDLSGNTVSAFAGDGTSTGIDVSIAASWNFFSATVFLLGYTYAYGPNIYSSAGVKGAAFWAYNAAATMTSTGSALATADGTNRTVATNNDVYWGSRMAYDTAGNLYFNVGNLPDPRPHRIFKVDSAGVLSQLLGDNNTTGTGSATATTAAAFAADCGGANCAQTSHWNGGSSYSYIDNIAYTSGKLIIADYDGTNCYARAITLATDTLTTFGTPGGGVGCNGTNRGRSGDFAAANGYAYWGAPNRLYKIAANTGTITDMGATPIDPVGVTVDAVGGNPIIYNLGVVYQYAP